MKAKQSPGPTALIKFSIWERGSVGLLQLRDQLILALKHSVCDVIMEYQILTAPICQHDKSNRNLDSFKSAPPSPSCKKHESYQQPGKIKKNLQHIKSIYYAYIQYILYI